MEIHNIMLFVEFIILVLSIWFPISEGQKIVNSMTNNVTSALPLPPCCIITPRKCPNENITFYLYTRSTQNMPHVLDPNRKETIENANFIKNAEIKFLIHGYETNKDNSPIAELRPEYFKKKNINVISVDFGEIVKSPCYIQAVANAPVVANCSSQIIEKILHVRNDIQLSQFHIIALSLGAEIAGLMNNYFRDGIFERITGLDPALPLYYLAQADRSLDRNDAKFVDVIHTNAGLNGRALAIGKADYYANSGVQQPGCGLNIKCSHERSAKYYAESITSNVGFWANRCNPLFSEYCSKKEQQYVLVGEYVNTSDRGIFFFSTGSTSPYALGKPKT